MPARPWTNVALFIGALALLICVRAQGAQATPRDPSITWKQIETEHFLLVYDSRQQPLAHMYARLAERAFAAIAPSFGVWPKKTTIVIDDTTDVANGYATALPSPTITAFAVLPTGLDVVSEYGDWGFELLTHEYTHILTFEPSTGIFRPLRWIFGGIMRPNIFLPRWYTEGLAVELETRFSNHGRLRSNAFLAIARAMVEEGTLRREDIGRINEAIPGWPGGNRPYLMGSLVWNEITRRGGDKMIAELNLAYSRRIPFLIDDPLRRRLEVNYEQLLGLTYDRIEGQAQRQIAKVEAAGSPSYEDFQNDGIYSHSPVISPDGLKLAHVGRAHNIDAYVRVIERSDVTDTKTGAKTSFHTLAGKIVTEGESITRVSWLPDSSGFIHDSVGTDARYYSYSDLYRYTLSDKKKKQLTKGLRAREPVVAPSGKSIVFVQSTPGSTRLACLPIEGGETVRVMYQPGMQTRVSRPEFISPTKLIFSERRDDGVEVLRTMDLAGGESGCFESATEPTTMLREFAPAAFPRMTRDGLTFISDHTGIANVYLANAALTDARALTNTTTRILNGELDAGTNEYVVSRLEATGLKLIAIKSLPLMAKLEPPTVGSLLETEWPKFEAPKVDVAITDEDFSPWPHLVPKYWMPWAFFSPDGSYVQASTAAADPVGRHSYAATAAYYSDTSRPSFFGQYVNNTTPVTLALLGEDMNEYIYSGNFVRHSTSAGLNGTFFLPKMSEKWRGSLGWQYLQTEISRALTVRQGPRAGVIFSNASQMGFEISPEDGGTFSVFHSRFFANLGNIEYEQTDATGIKYFSGWILPERHVIALSGAASVAPRLTSSILGRSTIGGNYQNGLIQNAFVMRGFPTGAFFGRNMLSSTLEYRFPLAYPYKGFGTNPIFLKRLHAAAFVDALSVDGLAFDRVANSYRSERLGRVYFGMGGELKFDTTALYSIPIQFILGYYYGADERMNPHGAYPFFGIGL